jgi:hypothetical protein
MNAYQSSLKGDNTTVILSPDSEFFRYFGNEQPNRRLRLSSGEAVSRGIPAADQGKMKAAGIKAP